MAKGRITNADMTLPSGAVTDDAFSPNSGDELDVDKQEHLYKPGTNFDLAIGATPVAAEYIVFVASTAGTVRGFSAVLNDSGTSTDVNFDLKKNGITVLTGLVNIVHGTGDRVVVTGAISVAAFVADDVFSIQLLTVDVTGSPQGPFAWAEIQELAQ